MHACGPRRAAGLAIGALSHYRFIGVIVVGFIALLVLPQGRRMLRDPRVWVALTVGVVAWLPLLSWNADNHDAGLKFQVVERHPWAFEWSGLWFLVIQPILVTPLLCLAMWKVAVAGTRAGGGARAQPDPEVDGGGHWQDERDHEHDDRKHARLGRSQRL